MLLFLVLTISTALSAYTTSGYLLIPLPGIDIIDAITDLTLILPIGKIDTASISYLNAFIILLPPTPSTRSSAAVAVISITISALVIEIKSIYYPPPN